MVPLLRFDGANELDMEIRNCLELYVAACFSGKAQNSDARQFGLSGGNASTVSESSKDL